MKPVFISPESHPTASDDYLIWYTYTGRFGCRGGGGCSNCNFVEACDAGFTSLVEPIVRSVLTSHPAGAFLADVHPELFV